MKTLIALCLACGALGATADALPTSAHIVYQARLGGFPVGKAEQRWRVADGHYTLSTELMPIIGPRIRYVSHGELGKHGLAPTDYAELRGDDTTPKRVVKFNWPQHEASYGPPDSLESGKIEAGAQELNSLAFQLAWLGDKGENRMQIATGRKLMHDNFTAGEATHVSLMGKSQPARVWQAGEGADHTEVWLAPELNNLPVKITRSDDHGELQLVAQSIEIEPEK